MLHWKFGGHVRLVTLQGIKIGRADKERIQDYHMCILKYTGSLSLYGWQTASLSKISRSIFPFCTIPLGKICSANSLKAECPTRKHDVEVHWMLLMLGPFFIFFFCQLWLKKLLTIDWQSLDGTRRKPNQNGRMKTKTPGWFRRMSEHPGHQWQGTNRVFGFFYVLSIDFLSHLAPKT